MTAVRYRVRRLLRAEWRSAFGLMVFVALVGGLVLTLVAGASRTSTAPDRYEEAIGNRYEVSLEQNEGAPLTEDIAALPAVADVKAATFLFAGMIPEGEETPIDGISFAGDTEALLSDVIEGRAFDPDHPTEFVASGSWIETSGADIGDRFQLLTVSSASALANGFDADPDGPSFEATLVGEIGGPADLQDEFPLTLFPTGLLDEGDIGTSASEMLVSLTDGSSPADLRSQIAELPEGDTITFSQTEPVPPEFREAVSTQTAALVVIMVITGAAGLILVGQAAVRRARLSDDQTLSLRALGLTRPQLLADAVGRVGIPGLLGCLLAGALAYAASGLFPRGFVERVEPEPGLRFDPLVHLAGPFLLATGLMIAVAAVLVVGGRAHRQHQSPVDRVTGRLSHARMAMGLRFAFARHARDAGSLSTPLLGLAVVVTTLVAVVTFGASFEDLVDSPVRWGATYDLGTGQGGFERVPDELQAAILEDPDVAGLVLLGTSSVNIGDESLDLAGFEPVEGDFRVDMLEGTKPAAAGEVALGSLAADRLGVAVGDELEVQGTGDPQTLTVSGLAVIPGVEGTEGLGQSGLVTAETLTLIDPESAMSSSGITVRDGASVDEVGERLFEATGLQLGQFDPPAVITKYRAVRSASWIVAVLLGGLLLLTVGNLMLTTLRRRGRDIAVLRSLGADRGWMSRVEHWHAIAVGLGVGVLSAVLGIAAGRVVFRWRVVDRVGASDETIVPIVGIALGVLAIVAVADLVAQVALRRRHVAVARRLATE